MAAKQQLEVNYTKKSQRLSQSDMATTMLIIFICVCPEQKVK